MKLKKQKWGNGFEIRTYRYLSYEIRTIWDSDKSFFVAQDICEALGLSNTSYVCRNLSDDEKILRQLLVAGQQRYMICISMSGLLEIVSKIKGSNAKEFLYCISRDVIPFVKNVDPCVFDEVDESQKVTNASQVTVGGCDIHFSLDLSLPPDPKSLAVLERITGIDLSNCLTDWKEKNL